MYDFLLDIVQRVRTKHKIDIIDEHINIFYNSLVDAKSGVYNRPFELNNQLITIKVKITKANNTLIILVDNEELTQFSGKNLRHLFRLAFDILVEEVM